ncbi:TonB-dependent receptor [Bacteroides sp.]|uniref:SusC/RagA family TonB-linked outer membrane protein n=1 Tax=Bacteroides sp. TaxID=29523 RepID=UPI0026328CD5|nr:TonB-dependent receptor [Bacteroides sp.]MDD3038000.1 TonB-dependent receptor [Bacteroides sp.]
MKKQITWSIRLIALLICSFSALGIQAQKATNVKGTVYDSNKEPLIGANVSLKGNSSNGTITDIDGQFNLNVPNLNSTLVISFIGYQTQEVALEGRSEIKIVLIDDSKSLEEVVVVGYGTQKRGHLTGSVSTVSSKELLRAPMQNVSNLLTGKVSGLTSIQSSGKPGADGTALYVRGMNAFSDNAPMVIVDGVARPIDYVNPNDIESISVLKDAAATIYGVQGANGVILITTKSGGDGPAKIAYDASFTMTQNTAMPKFLNARDYMYWHNKAREMDGLTPLWTADIQNKVLSNDPNSIWGETDWLDKVFQTGMMQQHNISASGGTEKTKYFASLGYMDQEGTLKNTSFTRYNVRANLDIQVAKNLKFTTNISGYRLDRDWPGTAIGNQAEFDPVRQAINSVPVIKSEYNGLPTAWMGSTYYVNGYAALTESGYKRQTRWVLDSNYKLEYDFSGLTDVLKGLKASVFAAYNYSNSTDSGYDRYYQLYYVNKTFDEGVAGASGFSKGGGYTKSASWGDTWLFRPQIDYSRDFALHHVSALFFYEAQKNSTNTMTGTKLGYYSDDPVDLTLGTTFPETPVTGSHTYTGQASWAGRLNYAYNQKYLAEFAFRYDGSYVFAPENRWGFFPSVAVGWIMSEENFFKKALPFVDYLKLRASYGESGNDNVTPYLYNSTFAVANNSMVLGNTAMAQFYSKNAYIYRNLTWSTTHSYNLGLEFNVLNQKLAVEFDVFYQLTEDILESKSGSYPTSLGGYYPSYQNSGKVDNRGFELTLRHNNRINKDWNYKLMGNVSFARNRVLEKAVTDNYPNYRGVLGQSMNARYGYQALGFFQSKEELENYPAAPSGTTNLGDLKYRDVNGDGIINQQYDYVKIGYGGVPEINFALNMEINYKNFYVNMLWQGVTHSDYELSGVYDTGVTAATSYTSPFGTSGNSPYYLIEGAWTPENTNAKYPRLSTIPNGNNAWRSSWWVVNGEYLRLKNMNIGYYLPEYLLKKTPFTRVNIYLAGTNLLTLSHFKYVDPESPSVSNGYYPQQRTFSLGLNVTF